MLCFGALKFHSVDQVGLELTEIRLSASQVLRLKVCATTAQPEMWFLCLSFHKYLKVFYIDRNLCTANCIKCETYTSSVFFY